MKISMRNIVGNWDLGYALDKHVLSSTYQGDNEFGRPQFDTTRSEVGEALYQLKYRGDWTQIDTLAAELARNVVPRFGGIDCVVPMPASSARARQPVTELAEALGKLIGKPVRNDLLAKKPGGKQLKDLKSKDEKAEALKDSFSVNGALVDRI